MSRRPKDQTYEAEVSRLTGPVDVPRLGKDGKPNPDYFRALFARWTEVGIEAAESGVAVANYDQTRKGLEELCRMHGCDPKYIGDQRSDAEIISDAVEKLLENPSAIFEFADSTLELLEGRMVEACRYCDEAIAENVREAEKSGIKAVPDDQIAAKLGVKKKCADALIHVIRQVTRLRLWARNPYLPERSDLSENGQRAAHVLRFMLYVGRSNISEKGRGNQLYQIGRHHARMAVALWEAQSGVWYHKGGVQLGAYCGPDRYEGCILVLPPGHGKTDLASHVQGLWLSQNPYEQIIVGHAKKDMAAKVGMYISAMFDDDEPVGRRRASLYPKVRAAHATSQALFLDIDQTLKDANLQSRGISEKISGSNATKMLLDDPVDADEADRPTERERTYNRLNNTWFARLRGSDETFVLIVATIWHQDDSVSRLIDLASKGKANYRVLRMPCGGPEEGFTPVWPEMYDRNHLKSIWRKNPNQYETVYRMNPTSKSGRIVSKVKLYDPTTQEHEDFIARSVFHASVDPAATNREKSDRAGVIYAAQGDIVQEKLTDFGKDVSSRRVLRIIEAERLQANQNEIMAYVAAKSQTRRIDWVHIECVAGTGNAAADVAQTFYDMDVMRHTPGPISKERRLRRVAMMLDAGTVGLEPVIEFPCSPDDPNKPHESVAWLVDEVLRFGAAPTDDGVDALTMLAAHLMPDLSPGEGAVTSQVKKGIEVRNERYAQMLAEVEKIAARAKYQREDDYLVFM